MYRLVAYHNTKLERESLDFGRDLATLKNQALKVNVDQYPDMHLVIENNGATVCTFRNTNGSFQEVLK